MVISQEVYYCDDDDEGDGDDDDYEVKGGRIRNLFFRKIGFFRICLGQTLYIKPRFSIHAVTCKYHFYSVFFLFFFVSSKTF